MAENGNHTYVRETERANANGGLYMVIGGIVVVVAFILWLVFGSGGAEAPEAGGPVDPAVTTDTPAAPPAAPPASGPTGMQTAPEPAPAPAAPAPAAPAAPAPAPAN